MRAWAFYDIIAAGVFLYRCGYNNVPFTISAAWTELTATEVLINGKRHEHNVALIGGGKLSLGHVVPLINMNLANVSLFLRKKDGEEPPAKKSLREMREYRRYITEHPSDETVYKFDNVYYYGDEPHDYWERVDTIIVSVGTRNYQSVAARLAEIFRERVSEEPVCLMAFENDVRPARQLFEKVQQWDRNISRGGDSVLKPCDVAVDSMCNLRYEESTGYVVANGQGKSDTVIFPADTWCGDVINDVFIDGTVRVLPVDDDKSEHVMELLEKKKAWFVNAVDYIVASSSLKKDSITLDPDNVEVLADVNAFCEAAYKELGARCSRYELDREQVLGIDSFLGDCLKCKERTLENIRIENEKEKDRGGRSCYTVLSDLGTHKGIYEYFNSADGTFKDPELIGEDGDSGVDVFRKAAREFSKALDRAIVLAKNANVSLEAGGEAAPDSVKGDCGALRLDQSDDAIVSADKEAIFRSAMSCMTALYAKSNVAPYLAKVQQRLAIVPLETALAEPAKDQKESGSFMDATEMKVVVQVLDNQLKLAQDKLFDALDSAERVLELGRRYESDKH